MPLPPMVSLLPVMLFLWHVHTLVVSIRLLCPSPPPVATGGRPGGMMTARPRRKGWLWSSVPLAGLVCATRAWRRLREARDRASAYLAYHLGTDRPVQALHRGSSLPPPSSARGTVVYTSPTPVMTPDDDDPSVGRGGPTTDTDLYAPGCVFLEAAATVDGRDVACATFGDVERHAQLGRRVRLRYRLRFEDAHYEITYNPMRHAHTEGPHPVRCPPHAPEWDAPKKGAGAPAGDRRRPSPVARIMVATLTTNRADGSFDTRDVTDALRLMLGPLGDFHARAGGVIGAYSLVRDLPSDVVSASLVYYDGDGVEHLHALPFRPCVDGPVRIGDDGDTGAAATPDQVDPPVVHTESRRLDRASRISFALPALPLDEDLVRTVVARHKERRRPISGSGAATAPSRRGTGSTGGATARRRKSKDCSVC